MMTTTTYHVEGMTCEHCVNAVSRELERLDGVQRVDIDLTSGVVRVTSEEPLDEVLVRGAVDEAGYGLVPS